MLYACVSRLAFLRKIQIYFDLLCRKLLSLELKIGRILLYRLLQGYLTCH